MRLDDPLPPVDPADPVAVAVRAIVEAHRRKSQRERAAQAEAWERNMHRIIGGQR